MASTFFLGNQRQCAPECNFVIDGNVVHFCRTFFVSNSSFLNDLLWLVDSTLCTEEEEAKSKSKPIKNWLATSSSGADGSKYQVASPINYEVSAAVVAEMG
jgi:hypothetical protein